MSLPQLLALYLLIGIGCAAVILWRADAARHKALPSAAAAVVVWPLWVPFALAGSAPHATDRSHGADAPAAGTAPASAARITASLAALAESGADQLLSAGDLSVIGESAARAVERLHDMRQQLAKQQLSERQRDARIHHLTTTGGDERGLATAQRHAATLDKLRQLQRREEEALDELADALELMNAQLALARFDDSESLGELKAELWLRIEALDETSAVT